MGLARVTISDEAPVRAFLGIAMPDAVRKRIDALIQRLRPSGPGATWVKPENLHITLAFLGNVAPAALEPLRTHLATACQAIAPYTLEARGVGAFPSVKRPTVVWCGVMPDSGAITATHEAVAMAVAVAGLEMDRKNRFHPHITLGRVRDTRRAARLPDALTQEQGFSGGEIAVENVALFASNLTPRGPVYTRLQTFGLAPS